MTKKKISTRPSEEFSLLETFLWENGKFFLIGRHLARLEKSADHFSFSADMASILSKLEKLSSELALAKKYRVRLLVNSSGDISLTSSILSSEPSLPVRVKFSDKKTDKANIFLTHKTTKRELYDKELELCRKEGYFEVLFTNNKGEVTEGAITNIIIKRGNVYLTPPLSSGVLPGTYREYLLNSRELPLKEQTLYLNDILSAEKIFIVNSVMKMVPAKL